MTINILLLLVYYLLPIVNKKMENNKEKEKVEENHIHDQNTPIITEGIIIQEMNIPANVNNNLDHNHINANLETDVEHHIIENQTNQTNETNQTNQMTNIPIIHTQPIPLGTQPIYIQPVHEQLGDLSLPIQEKSSSLSNYEPDTDLDAPLPTITGNNDVNNINNANHQTTQHPIPNVHHHKYSKSDFPNICGTPIPKIEFGAAIFILVINLFLPGLGTMIVGCIIPENQIYFPTNCCCFFWLGVVHSLFSVILIGYILGIVFGCQLIQVSKLNLEDYGIPRITHN